MAFAQSIGESVARKVLVPVVFGTALLGFAGSPVGAQDAPQNERPSTPKESAEMQMAKPSPILVIYKEDVKAGRVAAHDKLEANFARTYAKLPGSQHYLAMNSISGPNQAWFVQPYNTFTDVEKEYQANQQAPTAIKTGLAQISSGESDNLTNQTAITTVYREDLSYNASVNDLPKCRYVEVITYRVKPGHDAEFVEAAKLVRATYEKANLPMAWATYQALAPAAKPLSGFMPPDAILYLEAKNFSGLLG